MPDGRLAYNPQPMTEELVIDRSNDFSHEVLSLRGPLTGNNAPIFQNAIRREAPAPTLILDFADVPYVDSAGLGLLVSAFVSRQKAGRKMILSGINPRVQKLFEPRHSFRRFRRARTGQYSGVCFYFRAALLFQFLLK
jgi:anti-anti-sigma factor